MERVTHTEVRLRKHLKTLLDNQLRTKEKIDLINEKLAIIERVRNEKAGSRQYILPEDHHEYCGKILYQSMHQANNAMTQINANLMKKGTKRLKRSYFCKNCEAWHLTSF
jgi:hypothetical protein